MRLLLAVALCLSASVAHAQYNPNAGKNAPAPAAAADKSESRGANGGDGPEEQDVRPARPPGAGRHRGQVPQQRRHPAPGLLVLARKGRLRLREGAADWVAKATSPFHEAPLTHEVELAAVQLSWGRSDPADRFLAATAKVFGLTLATADTRLLGLGDIATLANR